MYGRAPELGVERREKEQRWRFLLLRNRHIQVSNSVSLRGTAGSDDVRGVSRAGEMELREKKYDCAK